MRAAFAAALVLVAQLAHAQALAPTPRGVVIAHDNVLELQHGWRAEGVANPALVVSSETHSAVIDSLANEAVIADLRSGKTQRVQTGETPIDAAFVDDTLYVLNRDSHTLQRIGSDVSIRLADDPAFLRATNGKLYVYSRTAGALQEIASDRITRTITVPKFAADLQVDANGWAYLAYPQRAVIVRVNLQTMKAYEQQAGAVPIAIARANGTTLAVADPASKRVWMVEGSESFGHAFARGFVRGLIGLGLGGAHDSDFPSGVDRVVMRGDRGAAYDSATGTLYRFTGGKATAIAHDIAPHAFAVAGGRIVWWDGTRVAEMSLGND